MVNDMFRYYKEALVNNLCDEYKGYWRKSMHDKEALMRLALQQQSLPHVMTYSYDGHGLSKEYIKKEFGEYINGKRTFYDVDGVKGYSYSMCVDLRDTTAFVNDDVNAYLYCDDLSLNVNKSKCPILYIGCKSNVYLFCDGYNNVQVYLFDESTLHIEEADGTCSVSVLKYSEKCKVEIGDYCLTPKIRQFDKELRL